MLHPALGMTAYSGVLGTFTAPRGHMDILYITERMRFLTETFKGKPKRLDSVRALIGKSPDDPHAVEKNFTAQQWRELLATPGAMLRYRQGSFTPVH